MTSYLEFHSGNFLELLNTFITQCVSLGFGFLSFFFFSFWCVFLVSFDLQVLPLSFIFSTVCLGLTCSFPQGWVLKLHRSVQLSIPLSVAFLEN